MELSVPDSFDETGARRLDVQEARAVRPWDREAVAHTGRSRDPGAGAGAHGLVADCELDLAFEDVERIGVGLVDVRVDRPVPRLALELEHLELVALELDVELPLRVGQRLALSGA